MEERYPRGKPKKLWMNVIQEDMREWSYVIVIICLKVKILYTICGLCAILNEIFAKNVQKIKG